MILRLKPIGNTINVKLECCRILQYRNFENKAHRNETSAPTSIQSNPEQHTGNSHKNAFIKGVLENIVFPKIRKKTKDIKIAIDFSSPNIAKPFHVGHLRSTIIGNFIANINQYFDREVTKINYIGDWGTQFGLLQYGLKTKNIKLQDLEKDPIYCLYSAYVEANKLCLSNEKILIEARNYFSDVEHGRKDLKDWEAIRKITIQELNKTYQRLGIVFDVYQWESDYNSKAIHGLMEWLEQENIIFPDDTGKKVAKIGDKYVTVLKSDNCTLYLARDIAALLDRYKKISFHEMLYVVDNSQTDHFNALVEIVKKFDKECAEKCKHIKFGRIRGMSTRSGNVIFLNDILDEAKHKMYNKQLQSKNTRSVAMDEATCDILGSTAVIINDLKQKRVKDYVFDWDKALQSEGDSGIKLQYLHCRLWSLEQNCGVCVPDECHPEYITEPVIHDLITELSNFEQILKMSKEEYEACILVNYLFRLAHRINRAFKEVKVKGASPDVAAQRLLVFNASRLLVKKSLEILGVKPLNQM